MAGFPSAHDFKQGNGVKGYYSDELQEEALINVLFDRYVPPLHVIAKGGKMVEALWNRYNDIPEVRAHWAMANSFLAREDEFTNYTDVPYMGHVCRVFPEEIMGDQYTWWNHKGFYQNPPWVLVLDEPDKLGFVQVAQLFTQRHLSSSDDFQFGNLTHPWWAESWNIYGLPTKVLINCDKTPSVDQKFISKLLKRSKGKFVNLDHDSPLFKFRMMEIELGSFFSVPCNWGTLEEMGF